MGIEQVVLTKDKRDRDGKAMALKLGKSKAKGPTLPGILCVMLQWEVGVVQQVS